LRKIERNPGRIVTNARAGQSFHNYVLAVDVCPIRDDAPLRSEDEYFAGLAAFARRLSLEWGGDWNTPGRPHLQLRGFKNWREAKTIYDGGIEGVWLEASRRNGV
jgi:peptidoglycan L-alanyl-D-glutamate endopeptidase CwlK